MFKLFYSLFLLFNIAFCVEYRKETFQPKKADNVYFIVYDKSFHKLIDTTQNAVLLYDRGVWLEGPQILPNGNLIVSDVKQNMLLTFYILDLINESDSKKVLTKWKYPMITLSILQPSHFQNGHALDLHGNLLAASHGMRGIERLENDEWQLLEDSYNNHKLSSPNDLIIDSSGEIWFSDPRFGLKNPLESYGGLDMQGGDYIYRLKVVDFLNQKVIKNYIKIDANRMNDNDKNNKKSSKIVRLNTKGLQAPNGLAFSPDEKLLYVADSARAYDFNNISLPSKIIVYHVNANKSLSFDKVFAQIDSGIPDGIKVDSQGNVWSSNARGIIVFSPNGKKLGEIIFPEIVGNLTFSLSHTQKLAFQKQGIQNTYISNKMDKKLFVTSASRLYMLEVKVESGIKR